MIDFSDIIIPALEGEGQHIDLRKDIGNKLYYQSADLEGSELGRKIYFSEGELELSDNEKELVKQVMMQHAYVLRKAVEDKL